MGMVEKYLGSLSAHLPEEMRKDVRDELESTIREQIEDRESQIKRKLTSAEIEGILKQLGHPLKVASAYLPNQHLIGPEAYPAYKRALKLALAWVLGVRILALLPFLRALGRSPSCLYLRAVLESIPEQAAATVKFLPLLNN